MSNWYQNWDGRAVDIDDPDPRAFSLLGVATQLSRVIRFAGATREPYSVAQHSVVVSLLAARMSDGVSANATATLARRGLLHDVAEIVSGDIPHPFKLALSDEARAEIQAVSERIERAIFLRFGEPYEYRSSDDREVVKRADLVALAIEQRDLIGTMARPWALPFPAPSTDEFPPIVPLAPAVAADLFIERARRIGIREV